MINFPTSPQTGVDYNINGKIFIWNGVGFVPKPSTSSAVQWKEDLTAWTTAETTVNLTSQTLRDFGTTPVTIAVTLTKTDAVSPYLSEFAFKFVFGTGGSFVYPSGITAAVGNPTLTNAKAYEANIIRGKCIYKEV